MNLQLNGLKTNYLCEGADGPTVLILPGWKAVSSVYQVVVRQLAETHCVYVLDLPGFGITQEPPCAWSVDDYAEFVSAFIQELHLDSVTLLGHSYGGRIIINLCSREQLPFTVREIVLVDSAGIKRPLSEEQQARQKRFKRYKALFQHQPLKALFPNAIEKMQKKYGSADYAAASPVMRRSLVLALESDYTDRLPAIKQKTLLIWGENDTATPISDAKKMIELIPNAKLETIQNAGHFPFIDQPFEFRKILNSNMECMR